MAELATMETLCKQVYNSTVQQQRLNEKTVVHTTDATVRSALKDAETSRNDLSLLQNANWLRSQYWNNGMLSGEIAKILGTKPMTVVYWLRKHGIDRRKPGGPRANKSGLWKGGRTKQPNGYIWVSAPVGHPRTHRGYVAEHYLAAEKKLGRYLRKGESVHHINGIKDDNRLENLMVFASEGEHQRYEDRLNKFAKMVLYGDSVKNLRPLLLKLFSEVK